MATEQDKRPTTEWRFGSFLLSLAIVCPVFAIAFLWSHPVVCVHPGSELLVEQLGPGVGGQEKENPNMFLVGASWQRLISGAEDVGLFKEFSDGSMRGFTCANKHSFKDFQGKVKN